MHFTWLLFYFSVSIEGYGDDRQQQLDAFPFSQPIPQGDDDAELRHKLKDMGGGMKPFVPPKKNYFMAFLYFSQIGVKHVFS